MKWNTIPISTPASEPINYNVALKKIISYYGVRFKGEHSGMKWKRKSDFAAGLEFINRKCGKHHKTYIRYIIYSIDKVSCEGNEYRRWDFHRTKVVNFLRTLHQVMSGRYTPDEDIKKLFDDLYMQLNPYYSLRKDGSDIISAPYKSELNAAIMSDAYTSNDKDYINRFISEFKRFDSLY